MIVSRPEPVEKVVVLFDGDILVYRAGFAAEKRIYTVGPTGSTFSSAREAKAFCRTHGYSYDDDCSWERNPEPVANAIHNLEGTITRSLGDLKKLYHTEDVQPVIVLTGCTTTANFREQVAPTYKANRNPLHKPTHYEALRAHLQDNYPTVMTEGAETDDYLCPGAKDIESKYEDLDCRVVIASIDKDLLCVPGWHYNFAKKELHHVPEEEADFNFFAQTLIGDTADNIEGVRGIGPVMAKKLLWPHRHDPEQMAYLCRVRYANHFGANWRQRWNENCHMLWIWREMPDECPYTISDSNSPEPLEDPE